MRERGQDSDSCGLLNRKRLEDQTLHSPALQRTHDLPSKSGASVVRDKPTRRETDKNAERFRKRPRKQITFSGSYDESDSFEPTSFFHPDYNCRLRSSTGSCIPCHPSEAHRYGVSECKGSARGLYHRSGIHLPMVLELLHRIPEPYGASVTLPRRFFIWLSKLYPAEHKLCNSCSRAFHLSVRFDDAIDRADGNALG